MSIKRTIITTVVALAVVAVVAPVSALALTAGCSLTNMATCTVSDLTTLISQLTAQANSLQGTPAGTTGNVPAACAGVTAFNRNLLVGYTGSDVKCLQGILNTSATTQVSLTGAGSPGLETTYFGPKTLVAVRKYQVAQGFTPANQVGPLTRAKLNAALGGGVLPPPPPVTGSVSAMVAASTPASGALIASQAQASLLDINFTGTGTVTSVTLKRSGISDQNTLTNVYLYDGNVRLTDGYSFNTAGTLTINNLSIAVSGSHVISVKADTAAIGVIGSTGSNPASSIAVALTGFAISGTPTTANVQGNTMSLVSGAAATASLGANTATGTSITSGTSQYTFWRAPITIGTRATQLKGANFKLIGSAPANALTNIKLFVDGIDSGKVASVGAIQGSNYAMFDFASAPMALLTGQHTIEVRADVFTGASRTIELSLSQASDITLYDSQIGVNIAVGGTVPNIGANLTIATGSSTIVVDPTFTSQTDVSAGTANAIIGKFTIHGYGEDVKVNDLYILPIWSGSPNLSSGTCTQNVDCSLNNVTLYLNGSQVGAQKNWTGAATALDYTLGSQMIIPAGQDSTLEVHADLQNSLSANYTSGTIALRVVGQVSANAYGQTSQNNVKFPDTSNVDTSGLAVSGASLQVSKAAALASYTAAPNQAHIRIGSFVAHNASTTEAVRLTTYTVALTSDGTTPLDTTPPHSLTGLSALTAGSANPIPPLASNTFGATDVLQPGASMTIDIYANVGSADLIAQVVTKLTVDSIGATSNVSTPGSPVTGQIVTFGVGTITNPPTLSSSSSATSAEQYIIGNTGTSRATYNIISTGGASTINELKLAISGSDDTPSGMVTDVCVGTVCSGQPNDDVADLTGLSLAVPNGGGGLAVPVTIKYATVGTGGVIPNNDVLVSLGYIKYLTGGSTKTLCTSAMGSCTATLSAGVDAKDMYLVGSLPAISVPTSGTGLKTNQDSVVGKAIITPAGGDVKIRTIVFNVAYAGYNTLPANITAANLTDGSANVMSAFTCSTPALTSGAGTVTCTVAGGYGSDYQISMNTPQEFDLHATTDTAAYTTGTPTVSTTLAKSTFVWDDTSYNGVSGNGVGLAGTDIPNFPIGSYTANP